jgi:hypothetical protein
MAAGSPMTRWRVSIGRGPARHPGMTRRYLGLGAMLLGVVIPVLGAAAGQSALAADPLSTALTGRWEGSGTILGQASLVELEWMPVLDKRFARLTWVSHIGPAPNARRFEGHAYYEVIAGGYRATWFDSSGMVRPIAAVRDGQAVVARWGTPEIEQGETTYRLTSPTQLEVVDRVLGKDGTWREFGRSTLRRLHQ